MEGSTFIRVVDDDEGDDPCGGRVVRTEGKYSNTHLWNGMHDLIPLQHHLDDDGRARQYLLRSLEDHVRRHSESAQVCKGETS